MQRFVVLLGLASLLVLPACQSGMKRDAEVSQQESAQVEDQVAASREAAQVEEEAAVTQEPLAGEEAVTQESQARESAEFYGQAPKFDNIVEKVVLEAKNGNVTLPHRDHAKQMDCKTCHTGTPGKMADFNKDKAHALCMGCHKEKGAGPTKCNDCHKK